jgi:hypothetical protein
MNDLSKETDGTPRPNRGEIVIYQTADGITNPDVRLEKETVWLTQAQMVSLFDRHRRKRHHGESVCKFDK